METFQAIWSLLYWISVAWVIYDILARGRLSKKANQRIQYRHVLTRKKRMSNAVKAFWIILTLFLGIIGALLYYIFGRK